MKRWIRNSLSILLFLFLLGAVYTVIRPLHAFINSTIARYEQVVRDKLRTSLGIDFSYRSLSPSILTGIHVNGIEIRDADSGGSILTVRNGVIRYNLLKLLTGKSDSAFSKLVLNDIDIELDMVRYSGVVEKIMALGGKDEGMDVGERTESGFNAESIDAVKDLIFRLPFTVELKNVQVHYKDGKNDMSAALRNVQVSQQQKGVSVNAEMDGTFIASLDALGGKTAGAKIQLNGTLVSDLSGSSATVSLDRLRKADYSLNDTEFLVKYSDGMAMLRTTSRTMPYSLSAQYNLETGDATAEISTKDLDPFSLVQMPPLTDPLKKIKGLRITTDASASVNIKTMDYEWRAKGGLFLPYGIIPSSENITFNLSGNKHNIRISSLNAEGSMVGASFSGNFNLARLQPTGVLELRHFTLPNGAEFSGDIYVDAAGNSYTIFSPQLNVGDVSLTALQAEASINGKTIDFSASFNDYSHEDAEQPGEISVEGTLSAARNMSVEMEVDVNRMYLDTIARAIGAVAGGDLAAQIDSIAPKLAPFISSGEIYLSTDMKDFTFNCPYIIAANTMVDRQMLLLSLDGSNKSVSVSQLEVVYGKQSFRATANADLFLEENQIIFGTDCFFNDIPYALNGVFSIGQWLSVTGDYGFDCNVNFTNPMNGTFQFTELPLSIADMLLSLSLRGGFSYSAIEGLRVNVDNLEVSELTDKLNISPKLALSGKLNDDGVILDAISYSDSLSTLLGEGTVHWDMTEDGLLDMAGIDIGVENEVSGEKIAISAEVTNPNGAALDAEGIMGGLYFNAEADVSQFPVGRFLSDQHSDDTLSGSIVATGTLSDLFLTVSLDSLSMQFQGHPLLASGQADFVDGRIEIPHFKGTWQDFKVDDMYGDLDMSTFTGKIDAMFTMGSDEPVLSAPLEISVESEKVPPSPEDENYLLSLLSVPEEFTVRLDADPLTGSLLKKKIPVHLSAMRAPGMIVVESDDYLGINGFILDDGTMHFMVDEKKPLNFILDGSMKNNMLDFHLTNMYMNLADFAFMINSDVLTLYGGELRGYADISGLVSDPIINGKLHGNNLDLNSPSFIPTHITTQEFDLDLESSTVILPETIFKIEENSINIGAKVILDRLKLDDISISVRTDEGHFIPVDMDQGFLKVTGKVQAGLDISYGQQGIAVLGSVFVEDTQATVLDSINDLASLSSKDDAAQKTETPASTIPISVDLDVSVGNKVNFVVNPILRGLVAPDSSLHISMDTASSQWSVKGDVVLRGGEVFYLSRNFYMKQGKIVLNESEKKFDPEITVRAETRERDSDGNSVTIILMAQAQNMSSFNPTLTSSPAKSEDEIKAILGQVLSGDSSSFKDVVVATGDWFAQTVFVRKIENALRDLCNFDIFSLRTSLLQNAINNGILGSATTESNNISNYFDNSTVYIGKYFGNDIYVDAMLQWTYDKDAASGAQDSNGSLVFRPEIGFELSAPFANIRWQMAPDLQNLQNSLVPDTSITLSWRITF